MILPIPIRISEQTKVDVDSPNPDFPNLLLAISFSDWYKRNLGSVRVFGDETISNEISSLVLDKYNKAPIQSFFKEILKENLFHEYELQNKIVEDLFRNPDKFYGHHIITSFGLTKYKIVDSPETLVNILKNDRDYLGMPLSKGEQDTKFGKAMSKVGLYKLKDYSPERVLDF